MNLLSQTIVMHSWEHFCIRFRKMKLPLPNLSKSRSLDFVFIFMFLFDSVLVNLALMAERVH